MSFFDVARRVPGVAGAALTQMGLAINPAQHKLVHYLVQAQGTERALVGRGS